jgi:ATP-dependent DNA ligase
MPIACRRPRFVFEQACKLDLEGIVAKPKRAIYQPDTRKSPWIKIKNPNYSQKEGRQELFER